MAGPETDTRGAGVLIDLTDEDAQPRIDDGQVRPMELADLPAVLHIERRSYGYPWSEQVFRDCMRAGYGAFVYTGLRQGVEGYLMVSCGAGEAHILNLCVDPDCRGQGVASSLLLAATERAELFEADTLFLEVRPSNTPARRLYERHGFNEVGRRPGYYPSPKGREDALVLARAIVHDA